MSALWLWLPLAGPIRVSTVVAALGLFLAIAVARRNPWRALVVVLAWSSLFEVVYHFVGIVGFGWPPANIVWMTGALAGWVVLAVVLGVWPDWRVSMVFVALMAVWVLTGFHYNVPSQSSPINIWNEVLNESAKTTLGLAYLVGALRSPASERRVAAAQVTLIATR
jgi:hypothetical protein